MNLPPVSRAIPNSESTPPTLSRWSIPVAIASIAAFCATPNHALAANLASDNFTLSSGSYADLITNTESAGVGTYENILNTGGISITTVSGFGSGNIMQIVGSTTYRPFNEGTTLTLDSLAAGTTLRMAFDIRFDETPTGVDFDFGFVNADGDNNSIIYANLDLTGVDDSELLYRTGSYNMSNSSSVTLNSFAQTATSADTNYTMQLDVTKQSSGDLLIEYFRNGSLTGSTTQASDSTFVTTMGDVAITGIAFRNSSAGTVENTLLDNISVTVIPEPSTALLLLGLPLLLWVRRRRA